MHYHRRISSSIKKTPTRACTSAGSITSLIAIILVVIASAPILPKLHARDEYIPSTPEHPTSVSRHFSPANSKLESAFQDNEGVGYIGVFLGDINEERALELKLNEVRGAVVGKVEDESPAARAGLREDDVILSYDGRLIVNRSQLYRMIVDSRPGSFATLTISRNGERLDVSVELGQRRIGILDERKRLFSEADAMLAAAEDRKREAETLKQKGDEAGAQRLLEEERLFRKESVERRAFIEEQIRLGNIKESSGIQRPSYNISANRYFLGLTVVPIKEQLAQYFNVDGTGLLVSEVRAGGAAEKAGIKAGDCIIAVRDEKVKTVSDFNRLIDRQGSVEGAGETPATELLLTIIRDRNEHQIRVSLESR